jgi:hypothetical protein
MDKLEEKKKKGLLSVNIARMNIIIGGHLELH